MTVGVKSHYVIVSVCLPRQQVEICMGACWDGKSSLWVVFCSLLAGKSMKNLTTAWQEGYDVTIPPQMVFSLSLQVNGNSSTVLASAFGPKERVLSYFFFQQEDFICRISFTGCSHLIAKNSKKKLVYLLLERNNLSASNKRGYRNMQWNPQCLSAIMLQVTIPSSYFFLPVFPIKNLNRGTAKFILAVRQNSFQWT